MRSPRPLRLGLFWHGSVISESLLLSPRRVTLGPTPRATWTIPYHPGWPARLPIVRPKRKGYQLTLAKGMTGEIALGGQKTQVADLLEQGTNRKGLKKILISTGDQGTIHLGSPDLALCFEFTTPPPVVGAKIERDPLLIHALLAATLLHLAFLITSQSVWVAPVRFPPIEITAERFAKYFPPPKPMQHAARKEAGPPADDKEEEGESKKAQGEEGKVGRADAKAKETILPKGKDDLLRDKVSTKGLLGLMKTAKGNGSGLGKLLAMNTSAEFDHAMAGLAGSRLVAGRGTGGLSVRGTGTGGGGTGFGRIYGTGDIDTGGRGHGRGKGGPKLAGSGEREVSVEVKPGTPDADGSLSREQVNRVVRAHYASIKYCYEKEIQRQPNLSGKIELSWLILPDGNVEKANIASSTMNHPGVESCIVRQVKQWLFPKSDGRTGVRFPFLFKGGM